MRKRVIGGSALPRRLRASVALLGALLIAACGGSGGAPAASPVAPPSCDLRAGYSTIPDGTRVDDRADGFLITLPCGWAQIELATGNVAADFSGLTMEPSTAAMVKAIGSAAERDGYEWLAVDLAPGAGGNQSATPADLLVDLSPANGAALDTIAARLTTDLRGSGVTGNIEQIRFAFAGGDALGIRYEAVTQDLDGKQVVSAVTDYITVRGDTQFSLVFSVAAANIAGSAAKFNEIAHSVEFHSAIPPGCSGASSPSG